MDKPIEEWIEEWGIMLDWEAKAELREAVRKEKETNPTCGFCKCEHNLSMKWEGTD